MISWVWLADTYIVHEGVDKFVYVYWCAPSITILVLLIVSMLKLKGTNDYSISRVQMVVQVSALAAYVVANLAWFLFPSVWTYYTKAVLEFLSFFVLIKTLMHLCDLQLKIQELDSCHASEYLPT